MVNTHTCVTRRGVLARAGLVYHQPQAIRQPHRDRNYLAFAQKGVSYSIPYFQDFRLPYRRSRRRFGSPWVDPINAALKHLKLATVTPGVTSDLSAFFASLFLCQVFDAFSSSFTRAAITMQSPLHTMLYQTQGSSGAGLQPP